MREVNNADQYVAWCVYTNHDTIDLCDSDTPNAFKVYRQHRQRGLADAQLICMEVVKRNGTAQDCVEAIDIERSKAHE